MSKHSFQWIEPATLKVQGVLDEDVRFEPWVARFASEAVIDFSGVTRINSCGVRQWTKAIATTGAFLRYVRAPSLIVDQFSMVPEFLGLNSTVESFHARYICTSCNNEESLTFVVGTEVEKGSTLPPAHACGRCGAPAEMDHNPEVYLSFLLHIK